MIFIGASQAVHTDHYLRRIMYVVVRRSPRNGCFSHTTKSVLQTTVLVLPRELNYFVDSSSAVDSFYPTLLQEKTSFGCRRVFISESGGVEGST